MIVLAANWNISAQSDVRRQMLIDYHLTRNEESQIDEQTEPNIKSNPSQFHSSPQTMCCISKATCIDFCATRSIIPKVDYIFSCAVLCCAQRNGSTTIMMGVIGIQNWHIEMCFIFICFSFAIDFAHRREFIGGHFHYSFDSFAPRSGAVHSLLALRTHTKTNFNTELFDIVQCKKIPESR